MVALLLVQAGRLVWIVVDPRATGIVKSPHIQADYHLSLRPSTNVAVVNARHRVEKMRQMPRARRIRTVESLGIGFRVTDRNNPITLS